MNPVHAAKNFWHVTGSRNGPIYSYHWKQFYLQNESGKNWCGDEGVKSGLSNKNIQEMENNDIVVSYQNRKGIVGLARLARGGYFYENKYWTFDLKSKSTVWFENPLTAAEMRELPKADKIEFIKVGCAGTVFKITPPQFGSIVRALLDKNQKQRDKVKRFLAA